MDYKIRIIQYLYYLSIVGLLILYLFPGSLMGCFFYGDCKKQIYLISNPLGTSINHAIAFFYLTILGLLSNTKDFYLKKTLIFLISLSILSELSHLIIPNRSFQSLDILANLLGTFLAIVIIISYRKFKNGKI